MAFSGKDYDYDLLNSPSRSLDKGKAAEHIVCADLILHGYQAYLSDQGLKYDLIVDISGKLVRVQVKSTASIKNMNARGRSPRFGYTFHVRRRGVEGKGKRLSYSDCDIVALIALDVMKVAYLPVSEVGQTAQFMPPGFEFKGNYKRTRGTAIDGYPFNLALERFLNAG